jgi:hypothetical protein
MTAKLMSGSVCFAPIQKVLCIRARLQRLRKNSCFVSGHDFSRAVKGAKMRALAPEVFAFLPVADFFRSLFSPGKRVFKPARMASSCNDGL